MTSAVSNIPEPQTTGPITMEQAKSFATASGDSNPVHVSAEAAAAAGLEGPVLHGMLIAGRFETFLEAVEHYSTTELNVRFVRPVSVGSVLIISGRLIGNAGPQLHLRLLAHVPDQGLVAIAEARMARA